MGVLGAPAYISIVSCRGTHTSSMPISITAAPALYTYICMYIEMWPLYPIPLAYANKWAPLGLSGFGIYSNAQKIMEKSNKVYIEQRNPNIQKEMEHNREGRVWTWTASCGNNKVEWACDVCVYIYIFRTLDTQQDWAQKRLMGADPKENRGKSYLSTTFLKVFLCAPCSFSWDLLSMCITSCTAARPIHI